MTQSPKVIQLQFGDEDHNQRLDKSLARHIDSLPRTKIKELIKAGCLVDEKDTVLDKPSLTIESGQTVYLTLPEEKETVPTPKNIPIDIIFEDEHIIVVNKPNGMVVHPGAGDEDDTLVHALLYHTNSNLSSIGAPERPGIVHRLDKNTTGVMVVAKTDKAHQRLAKQIKKRTAKREYLAIVWGMPIEREGVITTYYGRSPNDRTKMAVLEEGEKIAETHYRVDRALSLHHSIVRCSLETGRTHQIRVHMDYLGHAVVGDLTYKPMNLSALEKRLSSTEKEAIRTFGRQALHAAALTFNHPMTKKEMRFEAKLPGDMEELIKALS